MNQFRRALAISRKDVESYYGKPPLITWGLFFPTVLVLAIYVRDPATYLAVAPGVIAMTLLFGNTSMAAIVVTFEKRSGTLQRLLIAPVTHRTIILGKAASAAAFGIATSLVVTVALALLLGMSIARPLVFALGVLCGAATFALLGIVAAVSVREVFEAMTVLNLFRFPVLFISGVFTPVEALPAWLKPVAMISPLTYAVEWLRFGISGESGFAAPWAAVAGALAFLIVSGLIVGPAFRRGARR